MSRRNFLKKVIKLFFVVAPLILSSLAMINLLPSSPKQRSYRFFRVDGDSIPNSGVKRVKLKIDSPESEIVFFLVNNGESIYALSPYCTHLGCLVSFDRESNQFVCPCHQGRYDISGKALSGPPREPLMRLPIKFEGEHLYVGLIV